MALVVVVMFFFRYFVVIRIDFRDHQMLTNQKIIIATKFGKWIILSKLFIFNIQCYFYFIFVFQARINLWWGEKSSVKLMLLVHNGKTVKLYEKWCMPENKKVRVFQSFIMAKHCIEI